MDTVQMMQQARDKQMMLESGQSPLPERPVESPPPAASKFTEDRRRTILAALRGHHFMASAAALAGVGSKTVYEWLRIGAADREADRDTDYAKFNEDCERAIALSEAAPLKKIAESADRGDTSDAKWLLERRHADRWAKRDKVEVGGDPSQPIVVQLTWPGASVQDSESAITLPSQEITEAEIVDDGDDQQTA